jgi:serine/threonine protein kinase
MNDQKERLNDAKQLNNFFTKSLKQTMDIKDYEILKVLGKGKYGKVVVARKKKIFQFFRTDELVSIKILDKKQNDVSQVNNEINILETIKQSCEKYMLCYLGFGEDKDNWYIFTDLIPNAITLREAMNLCVFLDDNVLKQCIKLLIRGLIEIHKKGVAHCDIKPDNILLYVDSNNNVQIRYIDFGIACQKFACPKNILQGTPLYFSPELAGRENKILKDWQKSDMWALAMTIYELIISTVSEDKKNCGLSLHVVRLQFQKNVKTGEQKLHFDYDSKTLHKLFHPAHIWSNNLLKLPVEELDDYASEINKDETFWNRYENVINYFNQHKQLNLIYFFYVWSIDNNDKLTEATNKYVKDKLRSLFPLNDVAKILLLFSKNHELRFLMEL